MRRSFLRQYLKCLLVAWGLVPMAATVISANAMAAAVQGTASQVTIATSAPAATQPGTGFASPSFAGPSFDCAKAPGVDEQIICSEPALRQADTALLAAYRAALAASSVPAHLASLKADEHSWIVERNSECQITKYTTVTEQTRAGYVDCFLEQYAERIADLVQMKLHPGIDPTGISHPIRKSFLDKSAAGKANAPVPAPRGVVFTTVTNASDGSHPPIFAWRNDGALLILAIRQNGEGVLSSWRQGNPHILAHVPQAGRFARICALDDGSAVLVGNAGDEIGVVGGTSDVQAVAWSKIGDAIKWGCGLDLNSRFVPDGKGAVLDIGTLTPAKTAASRYVALATATSSRRVNPPIRIDSRVHLAGSYMPGTGSFVVATSDRLPEMQGATERRWSKSNCLSYWTVSEVTAAAAGACIPFGPYVTAVPQPLPTKTAIYFAAGSYGLYRIAGDAAQQVLAGTIERPAVSPDGCSIAFAMAAGTGMVAGQGDALVVLAACPSPTARATD